MGAVNAGLPIFLITWGEQFIDSGTAAVLNSLVPIFSLLIAGPDPAHRDRGRCCG